MRMVDIIAKKKRGQPLSAEEIGFAVSNYTEGIIPDYQMSALLMTICFNGMDAQETTALTMAYVDSGERIDLSAVPGIKVDKHSTGGVGDKISLVVIGLCAAAGIKVAKMAGRGLGHTGGTIDKLESIPGFRTELSTDEFISNISRYGMAITSQSPGLVPADKLIYALRDVTAAVDSIPLIAASVMSKKIASGADCIVLDVKAGSGAFMKSVAEAEILARTMVGIGNSLGRRTIAIVTDMNQPLGYEVGNANEVREAIRILKGEGAGDETAVAMTVASYMTVLGEAFEGPETAFSALRDIVDSGRALEKFMEFVKVQGGDPRIADNPDILPRARYDAGVKAAQTGYIAALNAESIGMSAMLLGAGRRVMEDRIDHSAGVTLLKKTGDSVRKGDVLCILHSSHHDVDGMREAARLAESAYSYSRTEPDPIKLIHSIIE